MKPKPKLELRPGFLTDAAWLSTVHRHPGGFYMHALFLKPFKRDCVFLSATKAAVSFSVARRVITDWLLVLEELGLIWRHQARGPDAEHGICIHFNKAGDYHGTLWVPVEPSHLNRWEANCQPDVVQVGGKPPTSHSGERQTANLRAQVRGTPPTSVRKHRRGKHLRVLSSRISALEHQQVVAATRTPDGAHGDALTDEEKQQALREIEAMPDELRRGFTSFRDRIAAAAAPTGAQDGLRLDEKADEG